MAAAPMSPADLYAMTPEETTREVEELTGFYFNHVPELPGPIGEGNTRVEIRVIRHVDYDHRRFWRLATVWLDDRPVMVIQNAGREGDDHARRYITDVSAYREMVAYLVSLTKATDLGEVDDVVDPGTPRPELTEFYGDRLR